MNAQTPSPDPSAELAVVRRLLADLRTAFERTVAILAQACTVDGALSARRLDERQSASYELALASADLLAAEAAVGADANERLDGLDARLALAFAAEAIVCRRASTATIASAPRLPAGMPRSAASRSTNRLRSPRTRSGASPPRSSRRRPKRSTATT